VARPALLERVRAGLERPLTLVAAPAGFGKTTLLVQALAGPAEQTPYMIAWLALDSEDDTPLRFWLYVAAALDRAAPGLGAAAQSRLQEAQPPDGQELAALLLNAAAELPADHRVLLTFDDYHLITAPAIQQQLSFLLDHLPPQLRVVILTRADPPLALPRRRARGELSEFRAADLRFSAHEIAAFFQQSAAITLAPPVVAALEQRSEGWIASLQLAALALEADPASSAERLADLLAAERNLLDYLADEVLAGLAADVQAFLLRTAVLDRLSAGLCAAVVQIPEGEAAAMLQQIERAGLFLVALDASGQWYRYHHLFAELLRIRLQRELPPPAIVELHRAAARWHSESGAVDAAVRHALAAAAPELAVAAIEARYLSAVQQVDGASLAAWLNPLPQALIAARPRLKLADAWRALLQLDVPAFERYLPWLSAPPPALEPAVRAEAALLAGRFHLFKQQTHLAQTSAQAALAELPPDAVFLRGLALLNVGLAQRLSGDLASAERVLAQAAEYGRSAADASTWVTALIALGNVRFVQGDMQGAEQVLRQVVAQTREASGAALPLADVALITLGWILAEQDRLAEAIALLEDGLALARRRRSDRGLLDGTTFLALAYAMRSDREAAQRALDEAQALAARSGPGLVATIVAERTARARLLLGATAAARVWALQVDPQQSPDELSEDVLLTYVRYRLAEGRAQGDERPIRTALTVLERLLAAADAAGRVDRRVRALTLSALAWSELGDTATALRMVQAALEQAAPGGFVRIFRNAGAPMRRLLAAYRAHGAPGGVASPAAEAFAERLLTDWPAEAPAAPDMQLAEPLTEREREVLELIAAGYSNAAIAAHLTVALTTVKAHLRNIFGKLDVGSRTQAVARARELGLIA
jgi:LuxR family maltose regulon positive regulatory protein